MKTHRSLSIVVLALTTWFLFSTVAQARVGGGRSGGFRGSRGMAQPRPYNPPQRADSAPYRSGSSQASPVGQPQPSGGGWMRGLGAGIAGGFLGSMLFGGMSHGGMGAGGGGGGIGFFEILLFAGLAYLAFRFFKSRQQVTASGPYDSNSSASYSGNRPSPFSIPPTAPQMPEPASDEPTALLARVEPQFSANQFKNDRLDDFFRLQAAWATRDLSPVQSKLTPEMFAILSQDLAALRAANQVNKLDNIAVRNTEVVEAWEEPGRVFATVLLTASLVDYTTDERTNEVVAGSKTEPVKFHEYWTFTRDIGFSAQSPQWRLSAIEQQSA